MTVETIFQEALSRLAAERAAFLEQACEGRPDLRAAVEALLDAYAKSGNDLDKPPVDLGQTVDSEPGEARPQHTGEYTPQPVDARKSETSDYRRDGVADAIIGGRYRLQEKIGEGGMGEVWVAKQSEPLKRKVALKLIKAGMDSRAVLQRFEQERQALALMDHPNIARVLDGGMTPTGQPFFVMELVNGLPLTKFCDDMKLTPRERLELFVPICQAVQHAHQKGIVHRDLKPANILVTMIDGKPAPKVIDFGVAKATSGKLTEETMSTAFGAVVGTLEYMSPEQAGFSNVDIDTRADIYSLGVILYELLTGLRPIDAKRLKQAALTEMIRIIREEEPSKPSTRLSTDESLASSAALRHIEPRKLMALLRGELDWVVMKCLEKQRDRRYESANGLGRDIQRYLANEPVEARPPSAGYRMQKFVRRNKGQVIAASLVLLALVGGIVGTSIGLVQAQKASKAVSERAEAEARANRALEAKNTELADEQAKVQARFELAQKAIATFHTGVSEDVLLKNEQFKALRTRLLKEAAGFYADLEKLLAGQTDSRSRKALAAGFFQLGDLTAKIGDRPAALAVHQKALAVRRELALVPADDAEFQGDVAKSLLAVAALLSGMGPSDDGLARLEEARDLLEGLPLLGPGYDERRALLGKAHTQIGAILAGTQKTAAAMTAYHQSVEILTPLADLDSATIDVRTSLATVHNNIGIIQSQTGQRDEALKSYRRALGIQQKLADDNPAATDFRYRVAGIHNSIGVLRQEIGKREEALESYQLALAIQQKLSDDNPAVMEFRARLADGHHNIGSSYSKIGKTEAALESYRKALAVRQKLIDDNPTVTDFRSRQAMSLNTIGSLLSRTGKTEEAFDSYLMALAILQKLVDDNPATTEFQRVQADSHHNMGILQLQKGKADEALGSYRKALSIRQKLFDANPALTEFRGRLGSSHSSIGTLLWQTGEQQEALKSFQRALPIYQKLADDNPSVTEFQSRLAYCHYNIGMLLSMTGTPDEALEASQRAQSIRQKLADDNPSSPEFQNDLAASFNFIGRLHAGQQRFDDSFAALDRGMALAVQLTRAHPDDTLFASNLGYCYAYRGWAKARAGLSAEAAADLRQALESWAEKPATTMNTRFERSRVLALLAGLREIAESGVTAADATAFADQGVAALRDAVAVGWVRLDDLKESDFASLRDREDFKNLIAELENKSTPPRETAPPPRETK